MERVLMFLSGFLSLVLVVWLVVFAREGGYVTRREQARELEELRARVAALEKRVSQQALLAPGQTLVQVYFTKGERVIPVARRIPEPADKEELLLAMLKELVAGPTAAEEAAGIKSQIPAGTQVRGATIRGGLAYVDFSRELNQIGGSMRVLGTLRQIAYTATEVPGVRGARLLVEGKEVRVFSGEGVILDKPLSRTEGPAF